MNLAIGRLADRRPFLKCLAARVLVEKWAIRKVSISVLSVEKTVPADKPLSCDR